MDVIIFVSGKKSSNGKALYGICKLQNERSYFVENEFEVDLSWFKETDQVGICGAASTPMWLMENVASFIRMSSEKARSHNNLRTTFLTIFLALNCIQRVI